MKQVTSAAKVLVATDNVDDGQQILRQLKGSFDSVHLSTNADSAVADFEQHAPAVLVLAFDRLEKAQRYYLGLYRLGATVQQHAHRTVILCGKDEVQAVFELCQKEYFDDYVLYWPHTHDGPRLAMSIWNACREMAALRSQAPRPVELFAHARQVGELDRIIGRELADTDACVAGSRSSLARAEAEIAGTFDAFSERLLNGAQARGLDVKDSQALAREIGHFKDQQIALARRAGASSVDSVNAWTRRVKDQIEPALAGTRILAEQVREIRPVVTGDARRETLVSSVDAGAAAFVVKPFTRESLLANLDKVLCR